MLKLKNLMLALVSLTVFMVMPAVADPCCKTGKFVGSYVRSVSTPDLWGDGSNVSHTFVYQLNLNRNRVYPADRDPTDPNGGTLRPLHTTSLVYKSLVASDADLLAP